MAKRLAPWLFATAFLLPSSSGAATPQFFFAGSGRLVLRHQHFASTLDVRYRDAGGRYDPDALGRVNRFFRSRGDGRESSISLRLIELLAYIQERYRPDEMTLLSGYRSPEFNSDLRAAGVQAAKTSLHTQGIAADVSFSGLDLRRLWDELRQLGVGGVGYYRKGDFLHVDTGPPRSWQETTSRVGENLSDGNARIFARTDFDRYARLVGIRVRLHSVTAFPLSISRRATATGEAGDATVLLAPQDAAVAEHDGCFSISAPAETYFFRVAEVESRENEDADGSPLHLVLQTCAPRIEKTPAQIESNPFELYRGG